MSENLKNLQKTLIGKESSYGSNAAATIQLESIELAPKIELDTKAHRPEGSKRNDLVTLQKEWTSFSYKGLATYTELGRILASLVAKPVTVSGPEAGVYDHYFRSSSAHEDALQSYTVQYGKDRPIECSYFMIPECGFKTTRDTIELSGSAYASKLTDNVTFDAGANEVQTITITGSPTGGAFSLTFKGAIYSAAYNISTSALQTALQALPTIGSGNLTVSGTAGSSYVLTFASALADQKQPLVLVSGAGLTGGSSPSATVTRTTEGGYLTDGRTPVLPAQISLYLDDTFASLGTTQLTRTFGTDWSIGNRHTPFWTQNASVTSFAGHTEGDTKETISFKQKVDAASMALLTAVRNGTKKFVRIAANGSLVEGTATNHQMVFDACVMVESCESFSEDQGIHTILWKLQIVQDEDWGQAYEFMLRNGISAY